MRKLVTTRTIDSFGRIALSPDLRKKCKIKEGDLLEIYIDEDNNIILKNTINKLQSI